MLDLLERRYRAPGVDTVPADSQGEPWHLETLKKEVTRIAKLAGIVHINFGGKGGAQRNRRKHLYDVRGTFVTHLKTKTDLSDAEIVGIMVWSVEQVTRIRRIDVDDTARQIALGKRIAPSLTPRCMSQRCGSGVLTAGWGSWHCLLRPL